jgi:hypothetical protein
MKQEGIKFDINSIKISGEKGGYNSLKKHQELMKERNYA